MKTVLITGSSSKITQATAQKFLDNNWNVITTYYKNNNGIRNVKSYYLDLCDEECIKKLISDIKRDYERIDVLVNNAAICYDEDINSKSTAVFRKVIDTNLTGTFLMCKYIKDILPSGSIINISSTNAKDTYYPLSCDYDASKAGVNSLTKNYAKYYAPDIRVNALMLGWVNTSMNDNMLESFKKEEESKILLKRFAKPEEIANVIYFLASDEASYINNAIIRVDGGKDE